MVNQVCVPTQERGNEEFRTPASYQLQEKRILEHE
jgi:hypothetical protein